MANSTIDPARPYAWGANIGWLNWRPEAAVGVEITQFVAAGFVYSQNTGWINLGSGSPANGVHYANNSASDFGVNIDAQGNLRGFAYGANIGWVQFESTGAPRLDLHTGQFSGFAYGANIGWINLGDASVTLAVSSIAPGADSDGDGLPDAWEFTMAGNLTSLSGTNDADQDGQTDLQEYLADTDPLDPIDQLRVIGLSMSPDHSGATIAWTSKGTRQYAIETRSAFDSNTLWRETTPGRHLADGPVTTRTLPAPLPNGFFRIRAIPLFSAE